MPYRDGSRSLELILVTIDQKSRFILFLTDTGTQHIPNEEMTTDEIIKYHTHNTAQNSELEHTIDTLVPQYSANKNTKLLGPADCTTPPAKIQSLKTIYSSLPI
jgi:hypothetical protein